MEIIQSESKDSMAELDEWCNVMKELDIPEIIHSIVSPKVTGPQILTNVMQLIQYCELFFANKVNSECTLNNLYKKSFL